MSGMMGKLLCIFPIQLWVSVVILRDTLSARAVTCNYDDKKLTLIMMEGRACIDLSTSIPGLSTLAGTFSNIRQTFSFSERVILR